MTLRAEEAPLHRPQGTAHDGEPPCRNHDVGSPSSVQLGPMALFRYETGGSCRAVSALAP